MPNLFEPLRKALAITTGYHIVALSHLDVKDLAGIATPKGTLLLQIATIRRLERVHIESHPSTHSYEVAYRLGMRYEDALEASCMTDLLDLALSGASHQLTSQRYRTNQRSFYLMELEAKATITYPDHAPDPIRALWVQLQPHDPPIYMSESS